MANVALTSTAYDDLVDIWKFIALDNVSAADRVIGEIHQHCGVYATQPMAGTPGDRFNPGLRYFAVGNYVVFYQPETHGILVIRVIHGARNLDELFP